MIRFTIKILILAILVVFPGGCQQKEQSAISEQEQAEAVTPEGEKTTASTAQPEPEIEPEIIQQEKGEPDIEKTKTEIPEPKIEQVPVEQEPLPKTTTEATTSQEDTEAEQDKPKEVSKETSNKSEEDKKEAKRVKPEFYDKCNFIFTTYVDKKGLVDYDTLRRKRLDLIAAAKEFENIKPLDMMAWSNNEKIAMWINAYNIFTLKLIVDNYPIQPRWYMITYPDDSIMQIPGAWTKQYFKVMGIEYTLREIEREILLARFKDPRVCFALSYATMGGAILRNEAYLPEKLDEQLDEQVKKYLAIPKGFRLDHTNKIIFLSNVFSTNKEAFIEKYASIKKYRTRKPHIRACLNFLAEYVQPDDLKYLESEQYSVKFIEYDWHLNEQPRK
jgi:hypothetical protein